MEWINPLQSLVIAVIFYSYNKSISKEVGRITFIVLARIKVRVGLAESAQLVAFRISRVVLYLAVIVLLVGAVLDITVLRAS